MMYNWQQFTPLGFRTRLDGIGSIVVVVLGRLFSLNAYPDFKHGM